MIVVEGCDGAGKSRLVRELCRTLDIPQHERMSTSLGGPVDDLFNVVYRDVVTLDDQPFSVYDRHALISEYIYGPIVRGKFPPLFLTPSAHRLIRMLAQRVLVVWCRPPFDVVQRNLTAERDMPGVVDNAAALYHSYESLRQYWAGESISYDYTNPNDLGIVVQRAQLHLAHFNMTRSEAHG